MKNKLDVGCGADYDKDNYVGVDIIDHGQEYTLDITKEKLPFGDDTLEEVKCHNLLEHISVDDLIPTMNELNRVLKQHGIIDIVVPRFPHPNSVADPTHKSFWHEKSFEYWAGKRPRNANYGIIKWGMVRGDGYHGYALEVREDSLHVKMYKH